MRRMLLVVAVSALLAMPMRYILQSRAAITEALIREMQKQWATVGSREDTQNKHGVREDTQAYIYDRYICGPMLH
jgi:hypothetical protein